jgi:hypothetical protein
MIHSSHVDEYYQAMGSADAYPDQTAKEFTEES